MSTNDAYSTQKLDKLHLLFGGDTLKNISWMRINILCQKRFISLNRTLQRIPSCYKFIQYKFLTSKGTIKYIQKNNDLYI